jgi:hypothetical protein
MRFNKPREFSWLLSQAKPFLRLHVASYFFIVLAGIFGLIDPLLIRLLIKSLISSVIFVPQDPVLFNVPHSMS